jgi:hypothetical protein
MVAVQYEEILSAFEFVGSAAPMEHSAYLSLDTGKIYWTSELASVDEELPDDLDTSDRYLVVPHKTELDLGRKLAVRFAAQELPDSRERAMNIFGAREHMDGSSSSWKITACSRSGTSSKPRLPKRRSESGARKMPYNLLRVKN